MTNWQLAYYNPTLSSYWNITNPTNELVPQYTTRRAKYDLYNGSVGRTTPSTKSIIGELSLEFSFIDEDNTLIKDVTSPLSKSLQTIIENGWKIRIKTHLDDNGGTPKYKYFEGYLTEVSPLWKLGLYNIGGVSKTCFDLTCKIDVTSEDWV